MQIKELYGLGDLQTNNLTLKKYALEHFPDLKNKFVGFPNYIGIEVEIEGCGDGPRKPYPKYFEEFWHTTQDGSLRDGGIEFVSVPLRGLNILGALKLLQKTLETCYPNANFSHRCGIHIHVNCRNYTREQVNAIVCTYLSLESVIFEQFVKEDRSGNAFCCPVVDYLVSDHRPYKYQALNRVPLKNQGTLEFRHLQGTMDLTRLTKWIKIISRIVLFGEQTPKKDLREWIGNLNTISNYDVFVAKIFGDVINFEVDAEKMERDVMFARYFLEKGLV